MNLFIVLSFALLASVSAIPVDNGVEGDPEIECGPTSITVNFNTRNPFEGHVFVKGLFAEEGCRNSEGGARVAGIELPFDSCNTQRSRSLNPLGVFVSAVVIITFHPQFITKVDRAYRIQCFYMEADKTVSTDIEVSMLTTGFQTQVVPMPVCRYEILDGPTGQPVQYAIVGEAVYHKWTCDTETTDTFCMTVHTCFVDDGAGDSVDLLDEAGCAQDRYLLRNLEYLTDLMAGQETHVFKYADRPQLFFTCQITITIKEPNEECPVPQCAEPQRGRKRRALTNYHPAMPEGVIDVRAEMQSLDLDSEKSALSSSLTHRPPAFNQRGIRYVNAPSDSSNAYCLSSSGFGLLVGVSLIVLVAAVTSVSLLCLSRSSKL